MREAMPPSEVPGVQLCQELAELTEAFWAAVREGDTGGLTEFADQRMALVAAIQAAGADADRGDFRATAAEVRRAAAALRRVLELDREILIHLEAERARIGEALSGLGQARRSLESYLGSRPGSPAYVDRVG